MYSRCNIEYVDKITTLLHSLYKSPLESVFSQTYRFLRSDCFEHMRWDISMDCPGPPAAVLHNLSFGGTGCGYGSRSRAAEAMQSEVC